MGIPHHLDISILRSFPVMPYKSLLLLQGILQLDQTVSAIAIFLVNVALHDTTKSYLQLHIRDAPLDFQGGRKFCQRLIFLGGSLNGGDFFFFFVTFAMVNFFLLKMSKKKNSLATRMNPPRQFLFRPHGEDESFFQETSYPPPIKFFLLCYFHEFIRQKQLV